MTTLVAIIGAIATLVSAFSVGTLIKFFVERKDAKDEIRKITEKNEKDILCIKEENLLIKAMCMGSLYDRTKYLGEQYINRGYISMQEYSDWYKYLYEPYRNAGGDGTIEKIKKEVDKLTIEG